MNKIVQTVIFLILILILFSKSYPADIDESFIYIVLLLDLVSLFVFFFLRKEDFTPLKKQYIRISYLFLISFSIVNFQMYIDLLLGNISKDNSFLWINTKVVNKSLLIASISSVSYMLGYSFFKQKPIFKNSSDLKIINNNFLFYSSIVLLFLFFLTINKSYLQGGYGDVELGFAGYFSFLFEGAINAYILINMRNLIIKNRTDISVKEYIYYQRAPLILLSIYLIAVMLSGDRGPLIFNGLFTFFGYIYLTKLKIKKYKIITLVLISTAFITTLGLIRRVDGTTNFLDKLEVVNNENVESQYYPASFSENTKELASSGRVLIMAINYGEVREFKSYGLFALQDLMLLFPSLKGVFIEVFDIPKPLTSSAQLLTYIELGADASWGVGTNCVADTYLDFGPIGIVAVFFLFGLMSRRMEILSCYNAIPSIVIIVCIFSVFSYSIYIPRATILYSLNKVFYISIFLYISTFINKKKFN